MSRKIKIVDLATKLNVGVTSLCEALGDSSLKDNPNARVGSEETEKLLSTFGKDVSSDVVEEIRSSLKGESKQPVSASPTSSSTEAKGSQEHGEAPQEAPADKKEEAGGIKVLGKIEISSKEKKGAGKSSKSSTKGAKSNLHASAKSEPSLEPKETNGGVEVVKTQTISTEVIEKTETIKEPATERATAPQQVGEEVSVDSKRESEESKDSVSEVSASASGLKVLGKIDLSAVKGAGRPSKKGGKDQKRQRINKNAVDVKAEGAKVASQQNKKNSAGQGGSNAGGGRGVSSNRSANQGNNPQAVGRKAKKQKADASKNTQDSEDLNKLAKEKLARLMGGGSTNVGKGGAKYRREKRDAQRQAAEEARDRDEQESKILKLTEFVTVSDLANMMDVPVTKVIGTCMSLGLMVSINMRLEAETIDLVAEEFGFSTDFVSADVAEAIQEDEDAPEDLIARPPIVTVMGHVDHGKTSLLDRIRNTNVIAGEAGGITQHIGAYGLRLGNGKRITFLDTPGHEAFTAMRARGAKITDIAIIIVAADDDVMPQTKEAINHASAAGVPIVFAINKIDKPGANPDRIREQLAAMNYLVEEWGGKYQCQEISAKQGINIDELLEKVLLEAEILELKANPSRRANGSVIESSLDKGRGYLATVMVQNGTLHTGDIVLSGTYFGKVKAMFNERNQRIEQAGPSEPVQILGLDGAPGAGETFHVMDTEQEARSIASKREQLKREQDNRTKKGLTLDELARRRALGNFQELNLIIKGDVDGSIEALSDSLIRLSTEEIQVNVIHKGVGAISESDVVLAAASSAIIIGFQVRPIQSAKRQAEREGVEIRTYSIIYDTIEDIKSAMEGMLSPEIKETVVANLEVLQTFKIGKLGTVAGCMVIEGKIKRTNKIRLIRDGIVKYAGALGSLKRFKDDAKEVVMGQDCGLNIEGYNDIVVGDIIEAYEEVEVKKTLD